MTYDGGYSNYENSGGMKTQLGRNAARAFLKCTVCKTQFSRNQKSHFLRGRAKCIETCGTKCADILLTKGASAIAFNNENILKNLQ